MGPLIDLKLKNPELFRNNAYVNGQWVEAKSGKRFDVIDPGTGEVFASCPDMSVDDVDDAVKAAKAAFESYRKFTPHARSVLLTKLEFLIRENCDDLARILVYESGVPLAEAYMEVENAAFFAHWFAGEAERVEGSTSVSDIPGRRNFTIKQPIGVVASLMPWNFPLAMAMRKVGGPLAVGCAAVAKPSPQTPFSSLALANLAQKAGFPKGVLNILPTSLTNTPSLSEALCKHPTVNKVSFTGSIRVGKILSQHCAENLKKLTLELGGHCPFLIFDDANVEQACLELMRLKYIHTGQLCITANRVYIQRGVYDRCASLLADMTRELRVGHGFEGGTTMGPLTVPQGLEKVVNQVEDARNLGATILTGGKRPDGKGLFYEPTVIKDATPDMRISHEETFGPVLALYPFDTEEEAVTAANKTNAGLASYCFTKDANRLWRLFENLEAGMVGLNSGIPISNQEPFGGIKDSGYGKESGKGVGVEEYLITKAALIAIEGHF
ncbi:aldehyde dehydrogenase [Xylaria nigripes]|nr:aldehyde dehydrogenase [Xylaria nigripes]